MDIIKEYEYIIKTNKMNIIFFVYQQGFRKFKEKKRFKSLVGQFKITKGTIILKMNIVKLVDKYPKMMITSETLNFLKKLLQGYQEYLQEKPGRFQISQSYLVECIFNFLVPSLLSFFTFLVKSTVESF